VDPAGFAGSIATFQLLPEAWVNVVALGLPPFEILTGLLILSRRWLADREFLTRSSERRVSPCAAFRIGAGVTG
jgi:hypothetical protein